MIKEFYDSIGGSYEKALPRLMKDKLIEKYVLKFPNDPTFNQLSDTVNAEDWETAFKCAHTFKGVTLNLSFEKLSAAAVLLTDTLRPESPDRTNSVKLKALLEDVKSNYQIVINAISNYKPEFF